MCEVEKLRCSVELGERSDRKDCSNHHESGKLGAFFAIAKIVFHGSLHRAVSVGVRPCHCALGTVIDVKDQP